MISILLLTFCNSAASIDNITESNDEMYHHKNHNGSWIWTLSDDVKQSINIKKISAEINGDNLTVTMELNGSVDTSQKSKYVFYCNTSDAEYEFGYALGHGSAFATPFDGSLLDIKYGGVEVDDNKLIGTVELINDSNITELWGYADLYSTKISDITNFSQVEYWTDWIPNSYFPYTAELVDISDDDQTPIDNSTNTTDNQTSSNKSKNKDTPGFEFIIIISVMILCLIVKKMYRKEKKR